jgi:predicted MPP superfamily phosphohydrolase
VPEAGGHPPRRRASFAQIALGLVALLHLYIGARLLPAFPSPWPAVGAGALLLLFLLVLNAMAPLFGRRHAPGFLTWAGLTGMGFFSSLLVLTLLRDAVLLVTLPFHLGISEVSARAVPLLAAVASLIGFFNARRAPAAREVDVPIAGLPAALHGFSIVQISDLHVGPTIRAGFTRRVVEAVNQLQPDVVAITGDVVDGRVAELRTHTAPLGELQGRHGVFLVTGNHEYYSGAHEWIDEFRRLGLTPLMNEHIVLHHQGAALVLAGITDFTAHHFDPTHRSDPQRALEGAPRDSAVPCVLLAHQPRSAPAAADAGFQLQISGHTHGGQFLPWNLFVPLQQPYTAGLHRHGPMWIYISRGTGYWGPPKRLGAPSEITRLRLVPQP